MYPAGFPASARHPAYRFINDQKILLSQSQFLYHPRASTNVPHHARQTPADRIKRASSKESSPRSAGGNIAWDILCDPPTLEKLKKEEKFWQIIALSRAVNTLSFAHWSVLPFWKDGTLQGLRARNNLFLYTCAALSEALRLIERMFVNFNRSSAFSDLKGILKTKTAKKLRNMHLERVRNHMVFHFIPESFGKMVDIPGESICSFVSGFGNDRVQRY